jgi:hypothetical protein
LIVTELLPTAVTVPVVAGARYLPPAGPPAGPAGGAPGTVLDDATAEAEAVPLPDVVALPDVVPLPDVVALADMLPAMIAPAAHPAIAPSTPIAMPRRRGALG